MTSEKWKLVGGRVYRLAKVFDSMLDAVKFARGIKETNQVFLSKTKNRKWAVYWRSKTQHVECEFKYYST
jgi:phage-related protein